MHGNVWDWLLFRAPIESRAALDKELENLPASMQERIEAFRNNFGTWQPNRGGSYNHNAETCRLDRIAGDDVTTHYDSLGFRLLREVE